MPSRHSLGVIGVGFVPYWIVQFYWVAWLAVSFILAFAFGFIILRPFWDNKFCPPTHWQGRVCP